MHVYHDVVYCHRDSVECVYQVELTIRDVEQLIKVELRTSDT